MNCKPKEYYINTYGPGVGFWERVRQYSAIAHCGTATDEEATIEDTVTDAFESETETETETISVERYEKHEALMNKFR